MTLCEDSNCKHPFMSHERAYNVMAKKYQYVCMIIECNCADYVGNN